MKNIIKSAFIALGAVLLVFSCSKTDTDSGKENNNQFKDGEAITISATLPDVLTKVTFTPGTDGSGKPMMALTWESGDKLRVAKTGDHNTYTDFDLADSSVGNKVGEFTGTPVDAESYDVWVIHPDITATQTQASDGNASHLKYMAQKNGIAKAALSSPIILTDISSVLGLHVKLPSGVATTITSVDLTASESIFFSDKTLTINLTDASGAANDELKLYATLPSGSTAIPTGTTLFVRFNSSNASHTVYTAYRELGSGLTFESGCLNNLKLNCVNTDKYAGKDDNGTAEHPYLIADKYQLNSVKPLLVASSADSTYFKLINSIDLNNEPWDPIQAKASEYQNKPIHFDGNGKTVSNLSPINTNGYPSFMGVLNGVLENITLNTVTISAENNKAGAIGGYIGTNGVIGKCLNVTVNDVTISGTHYIGGFCGQVGNAGDRFVNCHVLGTNTITQNNATASTERSTGGFAGHASTAATYISCTVKATVTQGDGKTINALGGFIGKADGGAASFKDCQVLTGSSVSGNNNVGGFIGYSNQASTFTNCVTAATVSGNECVGGFGGLVALGSFFGTRANSDARSTCISTGSVTATGNKTGGFVGSATGGSFTCCDAAGTVESEGINVGGFVGSSSGSLSYSYCRYRGTLVKTTSSAADINLGGFCGGISDAFTGSFSKCWVSQGGSGLTINSTNNKQRVGGFIGSIGTYAGANNTGTIEKCRVHKAAITGGTYTGGFAGVSGISYSQCCVTGGSVTAAGYAVGGFVGYQRTDSGSQSIQNCYVTTTPIKSTNNNKVAGMAGYNKNTSYTNCYVGAVAIQFKSGTANNGLFIGDANTSTSTSGCISWSNTDLPWFGNGTCSTSSDGYHTKQTTDTYVSSWATTFAWSTDIWNIPSNSNSVSIKETETLMEL